MNEDKELNLWDKIIEAKDANPTAKVLFVEDVKEAFRLLKDFINDWYGKRRGNENKALNEFVQRHVVEELQEEIDKLAGKLIEDYSKPSLTELRGL